MLKSAMDQSDKKIAETRMADPDQKSLKVMVEEISLGNETAFSRLLDLYEKRIFSFSYRMCGNREDAEDGTQEVFVSALRSLKDFRWEVPLLSWLFKIAANRCRRMRRLKINQPKRVESLDQLQYESGASLDPPSLGLDPLQDAIRLQQESRLQDALLKIKKESRMLVVLRDLQGLSTKETAEVLEISEGAVKTGLHRARLLLREKLGYAEF